ncbi:MAG: hypothetical protein NC924_06405 [Candidatus Omnitrophica bacterium]|nr:hypothetical protein [Candidatus Omnitrophota bacterium]
MIRRLLVVAVVVMMAMCGTMPVYAGHGYHVKCAQCGWADKIYFGGGKISRVVATGYCVQCKKIVARVVGTAKDQQGRYVNPDGSTCSEEELKQLEKPLSYGYIPGDDRLRAIFLCSECRRPFVQMREEDFHDNGNVLFYCPACHSLSLTVSGGIKWD